MKALVTGGGGFLGLYIVEQLLARGNEVRTFSRKSYPQLDQLKVETCQGDIRDTSAVSNACDGVDIVYHTAAVAGIWGPWDHYHGINTLGTENVIQACRQHNVGKLVFTSSPSVTFDGTDQEHVDETVPYPTAWLCYYPQTKALAEQAVLEANSPELLTCALRPHLIWGPRDEHLIPRLIQRAKSGKLRIVGDGTNLVDMVYVENAAHAHLLAADSLSEGSATAGQAYFISQGEPINCWEWINDMLALADLPPVQKKISQGAAAKIGAIMETIYRLARIKSEPRMTRFLAAQLATSHYFDISKAERDFDYRPLVSTEEGMQRLAEELRCSS